MVCLSVRPLFPLRPTSAARRCRPRRRRRHPFPCPLSTPAPAASFLFPLCSFSSTVAPAPAPSPPPPPPNMRLPFLALIEVRSFQAKNVIVNIKLTGQCRPGPSPAYVPFFPFSLLPFSLSSCIASCHGSTVAASAPSMIVMSDV